MKKLLLVFILLSTGAVGCTTTAKMTSGQIGCTPNDIEISDNEYGLSTRTWVATCRGRKFFCSLTQSGLAHQTTCKEAL